MRSEVCGPKVTLEMYGTTPDRRCIACAAKPTASGVVSTDCASVQTTSARTSAKPDSAAREHSETNRAHNGGDRRPLTLSCKKPPRLSTLKLPAGKSQRAALTTPAVRALHGAEARTSREAVGAAISLSERSTTTRWPRIEGSKSLSIWRRWPRRVPYFVRRCAQKRCGPMSPASSSLPSSPVSPLSIFCVSTLTFACRSAFESLRKAGF
mmetsp:Transcript_122685/g.306392  ORF Transcript_122685/g.306392 Transcript_122685/m.306392 type:complete len:210 (+) Transcript_122685:457-1086(+)